MALLLLSTPAPLLSQSIRGEVYDDARRPVEGARIGLFDAGGQLVASTQSGPRGEFTIRSPNGDGAYSLHVTRFGYRSVSGGPYDLQDEETLEVIVLIRRAPAQLEGVEAEVEGSLEPALLAAGFYERQKEGIGHFFEREEIVRRGSAFVADVLRTVPRVSVEKPGPRFGTPQGLRPPRVMVTGGSRGGCAPSLYIDGIMVQAGGGSGVPLYLDDFVTLSELEAMELYTGPATTPIEFGAMSACAVLLVWTRHARTRGGGR